MKTVLSKKLLQIFPVIAFMCLSLITQSAGAQDLQHSVDVPALLGEMRWKTASQVKQMLGAPETIRGPIGTHADYQLWMYPSYSVAIANGRVFHIFDEGSLRKLAVDENR